MEQVGESGRSMQCRAEGLGAVTELNHTNNPGWVAAPIWTRIMTTLLCLHAPLQAQQVCTELATSLGVRQLAASERDTAQVPFNVLPLASTVVQATGAGEGKEQAPWAAQSASTSTPMNVIKQRSNAGGQKGRAAASSGGRSSSDGNDGSAAEAAAARLGSQVQVGVLQQGQDAAGAGEEGRIQALEFLAVEMQTRLDQQAAAVRVLKEQGGRGNADPEVQAAVQVLLTLKVRRGLGVCLFLSSHEADRPGADGTLTACASTTTSALGLPGGLRLRADVARCLTGVCAVLGRRLKQLRHRMTC